MLLTFTLASETIFASVFVAISPLFPHINMVPVLFKTNNQYILSLACQHTNVRLSLITHSSGGGPTQGQRIDCAVRQSWGVSATSRSVYFATFSQTNLSQTNGTRLSCCRFNQRASAARISGRLSTPTRTAFLPPTTLCCGRKRRPHITPMACCL